MVLRRLCKSVLASSAYLTGADRWLASRTGADKLPLILGYHRVVPDLRSSIRYTMAPMLTSTETFEQHLDWLARRYKLVSLDEIEKWAYGERHFEHPVAAITFDDGYVDFYQYAYPILRRKGIPGAVFIVSDLVGSSNLLIHDELFLLLAYGFEHWRHPHEQLSQLLLDMELPIPFVRYVTARKLDPMRIVWALLETLAQSAIKRLITILYSVTEMALAAEDDLRILNWSMLRELNRAGITIGSHTRTHARLPNEAFDHLSDEVRGSRNAIELNLHKPVHHIAYPGGYFNSTVVQAVADANYRCAYTTCTHRSSNYPALTIPRKLLWENSSMNSLGEFSSAIMSCQVSGVFDSFTPCMQFHEQ